MHGSRASEVWPGATGVYRSPVSVRHSYFGIFRSRFNGSTVQTDPPGRTVDLSTVTCEPRRMHTERPSANGEPPLRVTVHQSAFVIRTSGFSVRGSTDQPFRRTLPDEPSIYQP